MRTFLHGLTVAAAIGTAAVVALRPAAPPPGDRPAPGSAVKAAAPAERLTAGAPPAIRAADLKLPPGPISWKPVLDHLRAHLERGGEIDAQDVRARLARILAEHPEGLDELLQLLAREENEDILLILSEVIGNDPAAMASPALLETLLRLAESGTVPAQRGAALLILAHLPRPDARAAACVVRLAGAEAEPRDLRVTAISTVVAWMQQHPAAEPELSRALLGVARAAADAEVRGHALQGLALKERPADAEMVDAVAPFLADANPRNRALAAMALGGAGPEARAAATGHLERALDLEHDPESRRCLLIHLVRAAGPEAESALERAARRHPHLADDVRDYREILAVTSDPVRVWELKMERDLARGAVPGGHEVD